MKNCTFAKKLLSYFIRMQKYNNLFSEPPSDNLFFDGKKK